MYLYSLFYLFSFQCSFLTNIIYILLVITRKMFLTFISTSNNIECVLLIFVYIDKLSGAELSLLRPHRLVDCPEQLLFGIFVIAI
jgi:hypothetical protein